MKTINELIWHRTKDELPKNSHTKEILGYWTDFSIPFDVCKFNNNHFVDNINLDYIDPPKMWAYLKKPKMSAK